MMEREKLIHQYFEKATALMLASAGVESVEKQALHLLAAEAERYAKALAFHAGKLAETARRSQCTAADIEVAATILNKAEPTSARIVVPADLKRKLRLSVDMDPVINTPVTAEVMLPQLNQDSGDMMVDESVTSPSKAHAKRIQAYPDWLQKEIESQQQTAAQRTINRSSASTKQAQSATTIEEPLSFISSLVLAESEARDILTKKVKVESDKSASRQI